MTEQELAEEYAYRRAERIAILTDGGSPTPEQEYLAEQEALAVVAELRRLYGDVLLI